MYGEHKLRWVVFEDSGRWMAVCLEKYIGSQGKSPQDALKGLRIVYRGFLDEARGQGKQPFDHIGPAPQKYQEMYETVNWYGTIVNDGISSSSRHEITAGMDLAA